MENQKELEAWLTLIRRGGLSLRDLNRRLEQRWPGKSLPELTPVDATDFLLSVIDSRNAGGSDDIGDDLRWLEQAPDRHLLPINDPRYPWMLREIPDPPPALFVSGDPAPMNRPCLSIVGSRNPTPQGRETAGAFAKALAGAGLTIVSGLALGIDGCAHRGALQAGLSIGVCAHGLDTIYPHGHRVLGARIREQGALVSELPIGFKPRRHSFPQRNRIISGMSWGTLVVEAGLRSGSLITARLAAEQNREVFAVPGPISSPHSRGCHNLIKNGAQLAECLEDVLQEIGQYRLRAPSPGPPGAAPGGEHAGFLGHMGYAPCTRDELVQRSGLTSGEVSSMLLVLELEGWVELCPGGTYVRVARS